MTSKKCLCSYRLFFRRHYPISSVTFSSLDPQDHRLLTHTLFLKKMKRREKQKPNVLVRFILTISNKGRGVNVLSVAVLNTLNINLYFINISLMWFAWRFLPQSIDKVSVFHCFSLHTLPVSICLPVLQVG